MSSRCAVCCRKCRFALPAVSSLKIWLPISPRARISSAWAVRLWIRSGSTRRTGRPSRRREKIKQNLEALPRQPPHRRLECLAADHEEAAHRVGDVGLADDAADAGGELADADPPAAQLAEIAARRVPASDREVVGAGAQRLEHAR